MKIVHLLTYLDSQTGGMERQAFQLAKRLRDEGHEIFFITCAHFAKMRREGLRMIDVKDGFRVFRIPLVGRARYLNMIMYGFGALLLLFLTQRKYQIIHAHQLYTSGLVASFAKLFLRKKEMLVKNAAGGNTCGDVAELKRLLGARFFIALMRRMADHLIAVSPQTAEEMQDVGLKNIQIIPNSVDTERFHPLDLDARRVLRGKMLGAGQAYKRIVLFVGRLGPEKNLFTLLKGVSKLSSDVVLYVVGDGILRRQLQQYVKDQWIAECVFFVGPRNDTEKWYQISDVFILPSYSEGLPNTLLEAMSSGIPCIGSDIAGIRVVISHGVNGYLVPVSDARALASAINYILSHPHEAAQIGASARSTAIERFSIDVMVEKYDKLYRTLTH